MKKIMILLIGFILLGCEEHYYKFQQGDIVRITDRIMMHPDYDIEMKKFIGQDVSITYRYDGGSKGNYYRVAEDGGGNRWYETFLELVEKRPLTTKEKIIIVEGNVGIKSKASKLAEKMIAMVDKVTEEKKEEKVVEEKQVAEIDSFIVLRLPDSKVGWFWYLYEKYKENGEKRSDLYEVWEYVGKVLPETKESCCWRLTTKHAYPRIWRNKYEKIKR